MTDDETRFLFIGGAPRSGTTLMARLLDGHPNLRVFPVEHSTFERSAPRRSLPPAERATYFRTAFLGERSQGQQTLLGSDALFRQYRERMNEEFGIDFDFDLDDRGFRRAYLDALPDDPDLPGDVLRSLAIGLRESTRGQVATGPLCRTVFKQPFYTELHALDTARRIPGARFIHVVRNPVARYASAKKRRVDKKGGVCPRINGEVFVMGLAQMSVSSLHLGLENRETLGGDRYVLVRFEDLVADTERAMDGILEWLDLPPDEATRVPSHLGRRSGSGSSFTPSSDLDDAARRRERHFRSITTPPERQLHGHLIGISRYRELYDLDPVSLRGYRARWWRPFAYERRRDHLWRLAAGRMLFLGDRDALMARLAGHLPDLARRRDRVETT